MIIINGVPFFKNNILKWEIVKDFPETGDTILLIDTKIKSYNRNVDEVVEYHVFNSTEIKNLNETIKRFENYMTQEYNVHK